ncbi:uncharacterized protein LOC131199978 [Ahaetulla prasina]|uniref:uncharacterized protein LOC131199978 n=1 Tax=Ahaetulla prasina TaxID=499056 RepID=UPI0026479031|nr:uncharacterized protein LOC131199978 [Ahaetulla prasina]
MAQAVDCPKPQKTREAKGFGAPTVLGKDAYLIFFFLKKAFLSLTQQRPVLAGVWRGEHAEVCTPLSRRLCKRISKDESAELGSLPSRAQQRGLLLIGPAASPGEGKRERRQNWNTQHRQPPPPPPQRKGQEGSAGTAAPFPQRQPLAWLGLAAFPAGQGEETGHPRRTEEPHQPCGERWDTLGSAAQEELLGRSRTPEGEAGGERRSEARVRRPCLPACLLAGPC